MTDIFVKQQSPDVSNYASSSGLSGDDKEIGYRAATFKHQYVFANNSVIHFLPFKIDLNFARMVMAEVVGTFILMFCVCGIIASTQLQNGAVGLLEYATTAGLTVVVIIFSIGPISCAHVNPAVTIAFATVGQFPWLKVPIYIIAQTIGSVSATYIGSLVYGIKSESVMTQPLQGCNSAFWVEVIASFIIMFLVSALASESRAVGHLSGFVAGMAIGLAVLITGPVSGGSMNPARSLGPAILSNKYKDIWIYIIAPSGGAIAGALMFRMLRLRDQPCSTLSSPNSSDVGRPIPFCATRSSVTSESCSPENVDGKPSFTQILVASSFGLIFAVAMHYRLKNIRDGKITPRLRLSKEGHPPKLERFSHYVARQMGFKDRRCCPHLCKLASEYIRKCEGCEDDIYEFFEHEQDADSLFVKLVEEFERCILSYFAFHWKHGDALISQVLSSETEPKRKLKNIVMAATREQRVERVTQNLKVARVFNTLVEEMKAMGLVSADDSQCTEVMAPVAHSDRSPVLLFMGGGMGAGKSTVLKEILKEPFWAGAAGNAVVIEADAFKESDVLYKALSSRGHHDMIRTAELVHQSSTDAASSLLVTALNEGRDVIMDGTLSWVPFVVQTITMARNVHRRRYRMGPGYKMNDDGTVTENYWQRIEDEEPEQIGGKKRKPYRIELVGVVCDAYLAVIRGIRRAIMCRRGVRVKPQLKSHKRFADAFMTYCQLVDNARLYSTNALEGPPKLIGWKDKDKTLLVDPDEIDCLKKVARLNEDANSIYELYKHPNPACKAGSIWKDIVLSPSRVNIQQELKYSIQKVEILKNCL
ncbi:hypothetical protein RIF29_23367 [Crotalaria pallida]|uniref:Zeta toxin domain-containing protein n=1 Tax=Crotalaria pallida TaxID=3830 RepID=A0AAN9F601_CROPI